MNIKITDKALRHFLETSSTSLEIANNVSLCGPTFDKIEKIGQEYLYEVEIITNRIDTASAQGIARDSAAILNQMGIKSRMKNDPYLEKIELYKNLPKTFNFFIENDKLIPRFTAISLENINISDSSKETKTLLNLCGQRPINNAVDITNEITILYGMPPHIFDLDKLAAQKLIIRESKRGEIVSTLNGENNLLKGGDIIIEDGAGRNVDLCGVMGGSVAEVDQYTKNILLIVPVYDPVKVRRTSLYLQNRTLASQIFEKQPDTELCLPVLMKTIKLFEERVGARVSSRVFDSNPKVKNTKEIILDTEWVNSLIGVELTSQKMTSILESLGFNIKDKDKRQIICKVPSWRNEDVSIKQDLVEEIARIYGYSKLPPILPCVNLAPEPKNIVLETESKIKTFLSCRGFNEIYNSSLTSENLIIKTGLSVSDHLKLTNALSKDFEFLRTSLVPSILQNIKANQGKTEEPFYIFEISNIYKKTNNKLPNELSRLVIASTVEYRDLKGYLESLFSFLKLTQTMFKKSEVDLKYYLKEKTAEIFCNGKLLGYIGSIKPVVLHNLGISSTPTVIELDVEQISRNILVGSVYKPISSFPEIVEQMTIRSTNMIGDIIEKIGSSEKLINHISYIDSYKNNHTFKITFSSLKNNLTQAEVNKIKENINKLFN